MEFFCNDQCIAFVSALCVCEVANLVEHLPTLLEIATIDLALATSDNLHFGRVLAAGLTAICVVTFEIRTSPYSGLRPFLRASLRDT